MKAGGAPAIHTLEICRGMAELGHEVVLFCPGGGFRKESFQVVQLPFWRYPRLHRVRDLLYWLICALVLLVFHLRRPFQSVYSRYIPGMGAIAGLCKILRLPWVAEVNGTTDQLAAWGILESRIASANRLWTWELGLASAIVTQGSGIAQRLTVLYGVPPGKIHVIDNGVDPKIFHPSHQESARRALGISPELDLIGYIGSYQVYHDLEVVVKALPALRQSFPNLALHCVGSGRRRKAVEKLAAELGVAEAVRFVDAVPYAQIPQYIAAFDLCLLTVPRDFLREVRAFKIREYLACGRPVLATAEGEFEDPLVGLCITVEPDSVKAVVERVSFWMESRESYRLQALAAAEKVADEYSWLAASRKTADILRRLKP